MRDAPITTEGQSLWKKANLSSNWVWQIRSTRVSAQLRGCSNWKISTWNRRKTRTSLKDSLKSNCNVTVAVKQPYGLISEVLTQNDIVHRQFWLKTLLSEYRVVTILMVTLGNTRESALMDCNMYVHFVVIHCVIYDAYAVCLGICHCLNISAFRLIKFTESPLDRERKHRK